MTHQDECPAIDDLTALLIEHGPAAMASALATLMNYATQNDSDPGNTIGSGANQANYYAGDFAVTQSASFTTPSRRPGSRREPALPV